MAEGEEKKDQYTERTAATVEESYSIFFGALSRMEKALGLNSRELGALRLPLFNLGNAMVNFGKDAMQLQRQSGKGGDSKHTHNTVRHNGRGALAIGNAPTW